MEIIYENAKNLLTAPSGHVYTHTNTQVLILPVILTHKASILIEVEVARQFVCSVSMCNLRGVYISIVNQTKQRLCQQCKHRELNLLQFTARSSSANLAAQEIMFLLNYSVCFPCGTMREDIIYCTTELFSSSVSLFKGDLK